MASKLHITAFLLFTIYVNSYAQLNKGQFAVGLAPDFSSTKISNQDYHFIKPKNVTYKVGLNLQYFIKDNFSLELGTNITRQIYTTMNYSDRDIFENSYSNVVNTSNLGVNHYYSILKNQKFFVKTSAMFLKNIGTLKGESYRYPLNFPNWRVDYSSNNDRIKSWGLRVNTELVYFITNQLALDLKLGGFNYQNRKQFNSTQTSFNFSPYNWELSLNWFPKERESKMTVENRETTQQKKDSNFSIDSTKSEKLNVFIKGRTAFFPNATVLGAGESYFESTIIPINGGALFPTIEVGLGKGFSLTAATLVELPQNFYGNRFLMSNLKYSKKISNKFSVAANMIFFAEFDKYEDNLVLIPMLSATHTNAHNQLSYGAGYGFGGKNWLFSFGYNQQIGKRFAFISDNIFNVGYFENLLLVSSYFKYYINKRASLDFGIILPIYDISEIYALPLVKATYQMSKAKK